MMQTTKNLSYEKYQRLRLGGDRAIDIHRAWKEATANATGSWRVLARVVIATAGAMYLMFKCWKSAYIKSHKIWITSPTGKTTVQLPLSLAVRVIKRQNWKFAEVELARPITRREALSILLFGDKAKKRS